MTKKTSGNPELLNPHPGDMALGTLFWENDEKVTFLGFWSFFGVFGN
jgi:hypothetical protein